MAITLYELAGAEDDRRFSPYCWRVRLALDHKGLPFESVPCRFTDKELIAFSGQEKVPVLVHDGRSVHDSWEIAGYLEDAFPERPSLFGGLAGRALSRFVADWTDTVLQVALIRLIATDVHAHLHQKDKAYFRATREERFGTTLEQFCADRDRHLEAFRRTLSPLRASLRRQPYLGGRTPLYADYAVLGAFLWARAVSPLQLLAPDDPVAAWRRRLIEPLDQRGHALIAYPC